MSGFLKQYIDRIDEVLAPYQDLYPWEITERLDEVLKKMLESCSDEYVVTDGVAIHKTATIEQNVVVKSPAIIRNNVTIGANAYLRSGVLLDNNVHIGAGCEIKQSVIFSGTAVAHFNYIGNSIVGSNVNFEAGSVAANHYNERENKLISVMLNGQLTATGVKKFGSLVGDGSRIGANAVLSPGTTLKKNSIVKRLELVEQVTG